MTLSVQQLGPAEQIGVGAEVDDQRRVLAGQSQEAGEAGHAHGVPRCRAPIGTVCQSLRRGKLNDGLFASEYNIE